MKQYTFVIGSPNQAYKNRTISLTVVAPHRNAAEARAEAMLEAKFGGNWFLTVRQTPVIEHREELETIEIR